MISNQLQHPSTFLHSGKLTNSGRHVTSISFVSCLLVSVNTGYISRYKWRDILWLCL